MDGLRVFLYILLAVLVVYLTFFFYALSCLVSFQTRLNARLRALGVIYEEKKSLLGALYVELDRKGVPLSGEIKALCAKTGWLNLKNVREKDLPNVSLTLSSFQKRLSFLLAANPEIQKEGDIARYIGTLRDLDANIRHITALYNQEIVAYEYWRKLWGYYPLFFVFGFRKRNRLA